MSGAQELREQATPFSVWLDLRGLARGQAVRAALPIWLESVQSSFVPAPGGDPHKTFFQLRLRRLGHLNSEIQLRLFFEDSPGGAVMVKGWTETGALRWESPQLGTGLGLPTSEMLIVPVADLDYLEIESPGDGTSIRGAFLTTLRRAETRHALDFMPPPDVLDLFSGIPRAVPQPDDFYLFGRVKATIDSGTVKLTPRENTKQAFEFELDAPPLLAVLTFECLNVDPLLPPLVTMNHRPLGAASLHLPDLADPAYHGTTRVLERDMQFHYSGWTRCQQVVPGSALRAGLNNVILQLNKHSGPIAVRALEIQLKNHWQQLDYKLAP